MRPIAILGSGFGLYGYLPALVSICGREVVLPERYRKPLEQRHELECYASHVRWAADEQAALSQAEGAVLALSPELQCKWLKICLAQPQLHYLILEKPLAADPRAARQWHSQLELSGKVIRIAYLFRYLDWAAELRSSISRDPIARVAISWRFLAHHIRHDVATWKRGHAQGGGAIRFYGIHLIALLAELGYRRVMHATCCANTGSEINDWRAVFSGDCLPDCELEIDATDVQAKFRVSSSCGALPALRVEQLDPFSISAAANGPGTLDARVATLSKFCRTTWDDELLLPKFYKPTIDLWEELEKSITSRRATAA